jgi:hypothetical protein
MRIALYSGLVSVVIGTITFTLHWSLFDVIAGPLPGYKVLLFPANLTLVYIWHPIFSEELALLDKFGLMMIGQFTLVAGFVGLAVSAFRKVSGAKPK